MINVMILPCGTEIGLEIFRSLINVKNVKVFGCSSCQDHASYICENYIQIKEYANDIDFINSITEIVKSYKIDYIIPAHDDVVFKLSQNNIGCEIITSCSKTCELIRSKKKTYLLFEDKILTPEIYTDNIKYPAFSKPDCGQGSKGCYIVNDKNDLKMDDNLLLEYLPGDEYTVDCFTHKNELIFIGMRQRVRIINGMAVNTKLIFDFKLEEIANIINKNLEFKGNWFFQTKKNKYGEHVLLEIASRISSCSGIYKFQGINLSLLGLYEKMGLELEIIKYPVEIELDRAWNSSFYIPFNYQHLFLDFDDCLLINDKINSNLIKFAIDARNDGKTINLITRNKTNLHLKLKEFKLNGFFDDIIQVDQELKSNYFKNKSLLIDDSFKERKDAFKEGHLAYSPELFNNY